MTATATSPAGTGAAGSQFEAKVGAFYILAFLSGGEPRGLPGAVVKSVRLQQRASGYPLDDVIVRAKNADGTEATLEIQAKRTLTFTASDDQFNDVVSQVWDASQKSEFQTTRYEMAVALARTTTRIEQACQEVLHWARHLPDGVTFSAHINRNGFSSEGMRDFVRVFRDNLAKAGAPTDDETVWWLLSRLQILVFDFESPGSDYDHRARERCRLALAPEQASRAADLWPLLIDEAGAYARSGGVVERPAIIERLSRAHGFSFGDRADLRSVSARLAEAAELAIDEIKDDVGGVKLPRTKLVDQAHAGLETRRVLHIGGAPGCGKTVLLKQLVQLLMAEGRVIVLRNGRIIPGGWLSMSHSIGCAVSRNELFNELGCGGGAVLFIDNIDQIEDAGEWATVADLLAVVSKSPGWRAVVTGAVGNDNWKTKLPSQLKQAGVAELQIEPIDDAEAAALSGANQALAFILREGHPAQGIARNLFHLSRMVELGAGQGEDSPRITSETDLARLWWDYGGGRAEDAGRLARKKLLRAMAKQAVVQPSRTIFDADDFDSATLAALLRFDSLREVVRGASISFRHDVLRDWTIGFLLDEDAEQLKGLAKDTPIPAGLARGLEIAARLALDGDPTGARWLELLGAVEGDGLHGSWARPVLLALPRSEQALGLLKSLKTALLESDGRRLKEIIRLMIAIESEPLAKLIAQIQPTAVIPLGASDLVVPKGLGWLWLVVWLVTESGSLPTSLIPDVAKVFQAWLLPRREDWRELNAAIVGVLFGWLTLIETAMRPRFDDRSSASPSLRIPHLRDVRGEIRMTVLSFAQLNPLAAERYLRGLDADATRHDEMPVILGAANTLSRSAPGAFADYALNALIEKEEPDDHYGRRRNEYGPFSALEHNFASASPGQGPFFDLLDHAPAEGLRLVRAVVEHAADWVRDRYAQARQPFPRVTIRFPSGPKSFDGDGQIYFWTRNPAPSSVTTSALMALEAWAHREVERGRPFEEVLQDVLGPDGSSIAFVAVAVDVVLSHWRAARDFAWPIIATPEILKLDDARSVRDLMGVYRSRDFVDREGSAWRVRRADLDARLSRQSSLSNNIGDYVFREQSGPLEALRAALEQARNEIRQKPNEGEDPINGLHATAERAVRMTDPNHWRRIKVTMNDGSEAEGYQFEPAPEEMELRNAARCDSSGKLRQLRIRMEIQSALLDSSKSSGKIVTEAIAWARSQPDEAQSEAEAEERDFDGEWNRRARSMAAALAARDYDEADRAEMLAWAIPALVAAATEKTKEYLGPQIEYSTPAIGSLGLAALYLRDGNLSARDALLRLASNEHPAVVNALGRDMAGFAHFDGRLPRSLVRVGMASAIHPRRGESEFQREANRTIYESRVEAAIAAEIKWLNGKRDEPAWPELPVWASRPRRGIRLGADWLEDDEEPQPSLEPHNYVDQRTIGDWISTLTLLTADDLPGWVVDLSARLMKWTDQANGPHGEDDRESDNRPTTWNGQFFYVLGFLAVAIPHDDLVATFLKPIVSFMDEAFHDAMSSFLRGFDAAMLATGTKKPENPVAVRELLSARIKGSWNYHRLGREKSFTSETHAGDALNAMFYHPPRFAAVNRPYIPIGWTGLRATMPILTALVTGAATSGYLADRFLGLIESSQDAAFLPSIAQAATSWCSAYGADSNFWSERNIGGRVCGWLDLTMTKDPAAPLGMAAVADDLMRSLDVMVRSGVAQAQVIEEKIGAISAIRTTV
jgi:hypothetical protein